jgi:hypothetical protein
MRARRLASALALATLAAGCGKKTSAPGEPPHASGTPHTDEVLDAWKKEGLAPDNFAFTSPAAYGGAYCARGQVAGVEALICEYADDQGVDRGKKLVEDQFEKQGMATAVVARTKRTVLAVADRTSVDPTGKTINRLIVAFRKL